MVIFPLPTKWNYWVLLTVYALPSWKTIYLKLYKDKNPKKQIFQETIYILRMSDVWQGSFQCYVVANKYVEAIFPISRIIMVFLCKRVWFPMFTFPYNKTKQLFASNWQQKVYYKDKKRLHWTSTWYTVPGTSQRNFLQCL